MIRTGHIQQLTRRRRTPEGWMLGDTEGAEVLLPKAEGPPGSHAEERTVQVFVHHDRQGRRVATLRLPKAQVGRTAQWRVCAVDADGAYVDWGLEPPLLIPYAEQKQPLEEGRWYVVRVAVDERTDRLYGSTRIERFLDNTELTVRAGDEVALQVFGRSELGLSVSVNDVHQGLVHANEVFKPVSIGDRITGYVKQVREDNKLDITLQAIGYRRYNDVNTALLADRLRSRGGFLPLTDKSSAEAIHAEFGISKKAFKQALGALYKARQVRIEAAGIVWVGP